LFVETIMMLWLENEVYTEHDQFHRRETASSVLLDGFAVPVNVIPDAR
jgi:hypothetical protein